MALLLSAESKESWFQLIYSFIKEHKEEEDLFSDTSVHIQNMSKDDIFHLFELEDELNDTIYYGDSIEHPGNNKLLILLHDTILYAYEKYEMENSNVKKIVVSSDMSNAEIFHKITSLVPFHRLEQEYFLDYMQSRDFKREEAEMIFDVANESWRKSDTQLSLNTIVDAICDSIENGCIKFNEVINMNKYDILEAVEYNCFERYSTLVSAITKETTLEQIMNKVQYHTLDTSIIYKVPPEDAGKFIEMFAKDIDVPQIMLFCINDEMKCIGIDNSCNECKAQVFHSTAMVKKWLTSAYTADEVEQLFSKYGEQDQFHEEDIEDLDEELEA